MENIANAVVAAPNTNTSSSQAPSQVDEMDTIPPNFELCDKHREAHYMRKINIPSSGTDPNTSTKEMLEDRCPCCGRQYRAPMYELCDDPKEFAIHGFGITLYFVLVKYLLFICSLLFAICAIILVMYLNGGLKENHLYNSNAEIHYLQRVAGPSYYLATANQWSLGRGTVLYDEVPTVLLLGMIMLMLTFFFSWVQFHTRIDALDTKLNIDNLTPADYTVMLTGVPVENMTDEEIASEFETHVAATLRESTPIPVKIAKLVTTYDLTPYTEKIDALRTLRRKKTAIDIYRKAYKKRGAKRGQTVTDEELNKIFPEEYKDENYEEIVKEMEELEKVLNEYNKLDITQIQKLGRVFVTFTRTLADNILDEYKVGPLKRVFGVSSYRMRGAPVMVSAAPEPEDVKWENLGYSLMGRMCRVILNWIITIAILAVCLVCNIYVSATNKEYTEKASSTATLIGLNLVFSTIVIFINMVLCFAIPIITQYERLGTGTGYDASVAFKLSFALFLNSGIIPIITYKRETYFTDGGFLMSVWLNWLCICLLNPLFEIFDVWYWMALCKWSKIKKEGKNSLLTQQEANYELEPYQVSMTTKFAQTISIMFYTAFYVLFFPPGILITIAGLLFQYWISKYLMINRYKVPRISGEIALYSMNLIGGVCFLLFLISGEVFLSKFGLSESRNYGAAIAWPIVLLVLMVFIRYCLILTSKKKKKSCLYALFVGDPSHVLEFYDKFKDVEYDPFMFGTADYKTMNPVTRNEGMKELMSYYESKATTEEEKQKYRQMQQTYQGSRGIFQNYFAYTGYRLAQQYQVVPARPTYRVAVPVQLRVVSQPNPSYYAAARVQPASQVVQLQPSAPQPSQPVYGGYYGQSYRQNYGGYYGQSAMYGGNAGYYGGYQAQGYYYR